MDFNQFKPLRPENESSKPFPAESLPEVILNYAKAIAISTSTVIAMAASAILAVISFCLTCVYRFFGKSDHSEPPILYYIITALPASKKSKVFELSIAPLKSFYCKIARQVIVNDATEAALGVRMQSEKSIILYSDEAGVLDNFLGKHHQKYDIELILKAWDCSAYYTNRITRDDVILEKTFLSICLACQPTLLSRLMQDDYLRGRGFLARFCYVNCESNIGKRKYSTPSIPDEVKQKYEKLIDKLLRHKVDWIRTDNFEEKMIHLSPEAYSRYEDYIDNFIEKNLTTAFYSLMDWTGKFHGLILRLAGIIHCVECVVNDIDPASVKISLKSLEKAISLGEYYLDQAINTYNMSDTDPLIEKAEYVWNVIKSKRQEKVSKSAIRNECRRKPVRTTKEFNAAIDCLIENGYIATEKVPGLNKNPKSSDWLCINPILFKVT